MKVISESNCRIVPATEADVAEISRLAHRIWRVCYPGIISSEQIEYMLAKMYSPGTLRGELRNGIQYPQLFIGTEFIGFASFGPTETPLCHKLHKLYLDPDWHGRGLGSLLLNHSEREAMRLGSAHLVLNVNKRNAGAIAVYERNGFRVTESVATDIGNGFVMDDYIMAKRLRD